MNLLADEGVDRQIVAQLRLDGHDVLYIAETEPSISDDAVFDKANHRSAILITADKDFGELVYKENRLVSDGVVLIRLAGLSPQKKAEIVSEALRQYEAQLPNHFSVISPGRTRIRSEK